MVDGGGWCWGLFGAEDFRRRADPVSLFLTRLPAVLLDTRNTLLEPNATSAAAFSSAQSDDPDLNTNASVCYDLN